MLNEDQGTGPGQEHQPRLPSKKSRLKNLGLAALTALPFLFGLAVALVILIPTSGETATTNGSSIAPADSREEDVKIGSSTSSSVRSLFDKRSLNLSQYLTESTVITSTWGVPNPNKTTTPTTVAPSVSPTTGRPTVSPSFAPSAMPTIPQMGCVADIGLRDGDRFDNEGNKELNHKLFAGQFVCSTAFEGSNGVRQYRFGIDPETGDLIIYNALEDTRRTYYTNEYHRAYLRRNDHGEERRDLEGDLSEIEDEIMAENRTTNETSTNHNDTLTGSDITVEFKDAVDILDNTVLDYYFTLSTEAAFRIHRVQRTDDYQVVSETLLWELPSRYTISSVYEDCLFSHDCPYMHLHRDGVMVLAWLDFELSQYFDGWMEKNIRSCYDFNTTDKL